MLRKDEAAPACRIYSGLTAVFSYFIMSALHIFFNQFIIADMAFDGSVVRALALELNKELSGGGISKITQPEKNELQITVKKDRVVKILFISVNPALPLMYIADRKKESPLNAPAFCMLLRKHLQGARIAGISQPSLERIIDIHIEHFDELGDLKEKVLTVELMGKHSNIIFREGTKILDSIRHISSLVSSVREVLPGRDYFIPFSADKRNPFDADYESFRASVFKRSEPVYRALYLTYTGFSPDLSQEVCFRAGLDGDLSAKCVGEPLIKAAWDAFCGIIRILKEGSFTYEMAYMNDEPVFFGVFDYTVYADLTKEYCESISRLLTDYYGKRQSFISIRQKSAGLRQIIQTLLNRDNKKYDLQLKQLKDTGKKEKFRIYGELLTAYGYGAQPKATSFTCENFYTGQEITIPLDPTLSAVENGKKYFGKYDKLKRTYAALSEITRQTLEEIEHLESVRLSLDNAQTEADIAEIKREMYECGYIKSLKSSAKGASKPLKSAPLHFISSDGFDIYVGKNNYQNEYISFKLADPQDWWFHAKKIPGSHVIVKTDGRNIPDSTFEEAAALAAYFSRAKDSPKAEVDYTLKKNLRKPPKAKPGFVIYHTNFSMTVKPGLIRQSDCSI